LQMEGPDPLINGSFCPTGRSSVLSADVTLPTPPPAAEMPAWSPPPVVEAPAEPGAPIIGGFEIVGEEIDEEIREVFLEEIAEERSEEHTSELQSREKLVCRLMLEN